MNLPNKLTVLRVILIPFFLLFVLLFKIPHHMVFALIVFAAASITDWFDGYLARKNNLVTNFGKFMDPLADKLTQISTLASLAIIHIIPIWILIIVLIKEFIMIVGASFLYGKDVVVYSRWYGKLATVLFYLAIVLSLVLRQFNITGAFEHTDLIAYSLALVATVFSLIMYVWSLYHKGFIDKKDLKKDVTIDKKN